ncbi:MaoC/PaaZ C-terminal domain-containing protein [Colwellia sp. MEBiC06753]
MKEVVCQQVFSNYQLLVKLAGRKRVAFEQFTPIAIRLEKLSADSEKIAAFKRLFQCEALPLSFVFNLSYRHLGQLLSQAKIPSKLLGLIHISSHFQRLAAIDWLAEFDLVLSLDRCTKSDKGFNYQITTELWQHNQLCVININQILDKQPGYQGKKRKEISTPNTLPELESVALSGAVARSYARVSGDYNPIHLSPLTAKLLGMKTLVIHGMFNLHWALCEIPQAKDSNKINAHFNRPCYLPEQVTLNKISDHEYGIFSKQLSDRHLQLLIN